MLAKLPACQTVDEDVARVVRDPYLLDDLAHGKVGQVLIPRGVGRHGFQGHAVTEDDDGLHGEDDGDGELGEDEVEGDPQQGHGGGGATRRAVAAAP